MVVAQAYLPCLSSSQAIKVYFYMALGLANANKRRYGQLRL